ncbi:PREDICTED: phosphoinositide phosphatase SAC7-like isoform X1 [Ipomoea nil]|uniref:phosphoinositide phosphatase SAC7-like isoform X1 n=1 Tax=Ipomoea nil TaxID=35883 RepID=UPI00090200E0|nr:PREDICTED: phosphoinositide phosphatase SAC7-like isoform X1 [Ipomoea nil]XP_019175529.1 PREDICTED: phosphoinositide phosphatase SAC7-like isoform X1 [Ipomoea nil]
MMEKADPAQKLYTRMRLWEFSDQYVIEPSDGSSGMCMAISRVDASMHLIDEMPHCSTLRVPKIQTVFGVVGMLQLGAGSYLIIITERECVGSYLGHPIFKVTSLNVLPCDHSLKSSSVEQKRMKAEFSALLSVAERTHGLYFSYDVNITLSAQRLHDLGDECKLLPLWKQADPQFLWNSYMMEVLIDNKLDPFLLPVLHGSFNNFQAAIGRNVIDVSLIARRCNRRTGTRMWRRGADCDGYVANFVESEQIIQITGFRASFVQVRGSIPILWVQIVDLTYKPNFEIVRWDEGPRVAERHFLDLRKKYGNVVAIDLVNTHGGEGCLSEKFSDATHHLAKEDVRYLHFDFHQICGHVHFERLSILYEQIEDFLRKNKYFLLNEKGEKLEAQFGVPRTNCIDCLDRTNVTQSMIGQKMLELQLRRLGVFNAEETISKHPNLDENFKILWANHGDDISIQYSGTPALKGDFVRYGKRTVEGILNDGCNALMRYYLNNFCDGTKQDATDLLHGHYTVSVSRDITQTSHKGGVEAVASFPMAFGMILIGLFFTIISLRRVQYDPWNLLFSMIWASISLGMGGFVKANGRVFCNRPRLNQPRH